MADTKTKSTEVSVGAFLDNVEHPVRRADGEALRTIMERITGEPAVMWGPSIVGFGRYHYRYASGHEGDMCRIGYSPRSANLVLYVGGFPEYEALRDINGNGRSESRELSTLDEMGIVSIGLERDDLEELDDDAGTNQVLATSGFQSVGGEWYTLGYVALAVQLGEPHL